MVAIATGERPEAISAETGTAERVVTNSLTMFGGQVAIKIISFAFNVIVIRYLGTEEYGKFAVCVAFGGLFVVLSDLGLATLGVKRIARDRSLIAGLFSNIVAFRILLSLGVIALTSALAWIIGYDGDIRLGILIAALGLLSYSVLGVVDAVVMGMERFRFSASLAVSAQVATLILAAILVFSGGGFLGLLSATTIAVLAVGLIASRRIHREIPLTAPIEPRAWPELLKSAFPFAAITLALTISYKADAVILSFWVSSSLIGVYAVAYNLIFTFVTLSKSINLTLFPMLTREYAESPERALVYFQQGFRYIFFISVPVAVFVSFNARGIVILLYGEQFARAAPALALLAWVVPLMFLSEFLGYVAIVMDRESLAARSNWVSTGSNIVANLAFIPLFGIVAAAATTLLTEMLLVGQYFVGLRDSGLLADRQQTVGRTILAVLLLAVVLFGLHLLGWHVIIVGFVSMTVYFALAFLVGALGAKEVSFLATMVKARLGGRV